MKAIQELGIRKSIRFVIYSLLWAIYHQIVNHLFYLPLTRKYFLQLLGAKIEKDSIIMDVKFFNWHQKGPQGLVIGKKCFIGDDCLLDLYESITLEDHVTLGQRVLVLTHTSVGYSDHPLQKYFKRTKKPVIFQSGCFVGAGSIILPGVTVGQKAFIAAGSVVTENIPSKSLYAGVPAKLVRKLK